MSTEVKNTVTKSGNGTIKPFAEDAQEEFDLTMWEEEEITVLKEVIVSVSPGRDADENPRVSLCISPDDGFSDASSSWDIGDLIADAFTGDCDFDEEISALVKLRSRIDDVIAKLKLEQEEESTPPLNAAMLTFMQAMTPCWP